MPTYRAPVDDMLYVLEDVLHVEKYDNLKTFRDASPDIIKAILKEGAKFNEEVLQPLNQSGDQEGCTHKRDGSVTTPKGFKEAYKLYCEGGWGGLTGPQEYGGQGLPHILGTAFEEMMTSANLSFSLYPFLTVGVVNLLDRIASKELKEIYLPNLVSGKWAGTMNLTEPHCGTDLRLLKTRAEKQKDGSYKLTGTKIFISAGEHDLAENIIHLVLAKIPGGPEGVKGISLFLVPKYKVKKDGSPGEKNGVSCGSIEEKMGLHGNATCLLNYDGAGGYLVGKEHEGLKAMFIMMNAARIGVGLQGLGVSEVAYQNAAEYALDRRQGRALSGPRDPEESADPIIVHPDVRRMLMDAKAFNEGARALTLWAGLNMDLAAHGPEEKDREEAELLLSLMTPVIKGVLTDLGYKNATEAQQVFGGHGYIREWGMEQFVRDARIAMIYEGTNGIQAMDLVGRKLPKDNGKAVRHYFALLEGYCKDYETDFPKYIKPLKSAIADLKKATMWLMENAMETPEHAGAAAHNYMHLMGLVALGHMWAWMAVTSEKAIKEKSGNKKFHENKIVTARYFLNRHLPQTANHLKIIEAGSGDMMALPDDAF